jgi:hypothetical protein
MTAEAACPGARWTFDASGEVTGRALIPAERPVVRATFRDGASAPWRVDGCRADGSTLLVRNGVSALVRADAVLVVRAARPAEVRVEPLFRPEYAEAAHGRRLLLDDAGGLGVYPTRPARAGPRPPFVHGLAAGDELWRAICPSRPPSEERLAQHVAHEGRPRPFPEAAYPSTAIVEDAARHCRVLALHAYFWAAGPRRVDLSAGRYALRRRPWTTSRHVPADPDRFERVKEDARRHGMKLVVYLSPRHTTAPDLADEMRRVLDEYGVDGLYLDGVGGDFRAADAVLRRTREILGEDRILYLNASDEPFGTPRVHCPFLDARADFVLRGDSGRGGLDLSRFLRYAVSGRNVSNAAGMWCHYGSAGRLLPVERAPPARHVAAAVGHGVRLWRRSVWGAQALAEFDRAYYPAVDGDGTA